MKAIDEPLVRLDAVVISQRAVGKDLYQLIFSAPEFVSLARPGQFVEILTGDKHSSDPLLRRPISLYSLDKKLGQAGIVYRAVGRGTQWLADRRAGEQLDIFGPVGNGFILPADAKKILLVAGGIGMPPLYGLVQAYPDRDYLLYYGGQKASDLILLKEWEKLGVPYRLATDDGSGEFAGRVTDRLKVETPLGFDLCCACGPKPMLRALQQYLTNNNIKGLFSLEERMACGVGACLGCVCKTKNDGYQRVCVDGPVFPAEEVVFE